MTAGDILDYAYTGAAQTVVLPPGRYRLHRGLVGGGEHVTLDDLITDRTAADAARVRALADKGYDAWTAAELAWWRSDPKGAYNASDLNRVGSAVDYVAKRLRSCGISVSVAPRMDWANGDKPNRDEMAAYLADIATLRAALPLRDGTPPAPGGMLGLTWEEANAIESILLAVDETVTRMSQAWFFSGDLYAGEC